MPNGVAHLDVKLCRYFTLDKQEQKALDDIEKHGCHVLHVMEGEGEPRFAYSIGIEKSIGYPEITIQGLKKDLAHSMINNYNRRLREGEVFEPGRYYSDFIEGFDICFIEVDSKHYKEYFGWANWLYDKKEFRVLQLIWPTVDGVWPWDVDSSEYYKWAQPILNESGKLIEEI